MSNPITGVITDNEKCVMFFVVKQSVYDEVYGLFKPISEPIRCYYNDCGRFIVLDEDKVVLERFIDYVKPFLVEMEQGKNEYHDIPVNKDLLTEDYIFEMLHEERFFLKDRFIKENLKVQLHVVHESYFYGVTEKYIFNDCEKLITKETFTNEIKEHFEEFNTKLESSLLDIQLKFQLEDLLEEKKEYSSIRKVLYELNRESHILKYFSNLLDSKYRHIPFSVLEQKQIDNIFNLAVYSCFIYNSGRDFYPIAYSGQDSGIMENLLHSELFNTLIKEKIESMYETEVNKDITYEELKESIYKDYFKEDE